MELWNWALFLEKRRSFKIHLKVVSELDRTGWHGFCCVLDNAKTLFKSPSNTAWWDAGFEDTITFLQ